MDPELNFSLMLIQLFWKLNVFPVLLKDGQKKLKIRVLLKLFLPL